MEPAQVCHVLHLCITVGGKGVQKASLLLEESYMLSAVQLIGGGAVRGETCPGEWVRASHSLTYFQKNRTRSSCCAWLCLPSGSFLGTLSHCFRNAIVFNSRSLLLLLCGHKCLNRRVIKLLEVYADSYHKKHFFEGTFIKVLLVGGAVILPCLLLQAVLPT